MPRSLKDEVDLHLPGLEGKYILKLQGMEPGVGICILWTTEVNINSELAEQKKAAATSPATVSPVEVPNSGACYLTSSQRRDAMRNSHQFD
jgi:hypothetical protein